MNTVRSIFPVHIILILVLVLVATSGCQPPQERVQEERVEAGKEIKKAEQDVLSEKKEAKGEIAAATGSNVAEEKVEATLEIGKAEGKVDDEKIEATKEITDAEQDAGAGGSYSKE